jgi:hypothetical protein
LKGLIARHLYKSFGVKGLTGMCCGKAVKGVGMLGVSVRKMKALTVRVETVTLVGKGR